MLDRIGNYLCAAIIAILVGLWLFSIALVVIGQFSKARAHDSWISRGQMKNAAGEWCCGAGDCGIFDKGAVTILRTGYRVRGFLTIVGTNERLFIDELVPFAEAQPSPDGSYVRCHRSDMTRRCFFAPTPSY